MPFVTIWQEDGIQIGFKNLTFNLATTYSYITVPPIFADIGDAMMHIAPTNFTTSVGSHYVRTATGKQFELNFHSVELTSNMTNQAPFAKFTGVNDFSQII